jgi:hypothetical protein
MKFNLPLCFVLGGLVSAAAGPVRPIVSGQLNQTALVPNGPPRDAGAARGQWFINSTNGTEVVNTWEFHDSDAPLSIHGVVTSILWGANSPVVGYTNIAGFTILATISNNPAAGPMLPGLATNAHWEQQLPPQPYYHETLWNARIAAEFAVAQAGPGGPPFVGAAPFVPGMAPPYYLDPFGGNQYVIEAQNETHAAWYCYSAPDPNNPQNPPGQYYVPAWELGDIPPGQSAQVVMEFRIKTYGGAPTELPLSDLRHSVIRASFMYGYDVLYNRAESLKLSDWLDYLLVDGGNLIYSPNDPYASEPPIELITASDVSVFFNSAAPGVKPAMQIWPQFSNGTLVAVQVSWSMPDVYPVVLQYCDDLTKNQWQAVPIFVPLPPLIPGPMSWTDNGSVILPPLQSPRFYRLHLP